MYLVERDTIEHVCSDRPRERQKVIFVDKKCLEWTIRLLLLLLLLKQV